MSRWEQIVSAIAAVDLAAFDCGEWQEGKFDIDYETLFQRSVNAQRRLLRLLDVPRQHWPLDTLEK
jgi:hypothetical protein